MRNGPRFTPPPGVVGWVLEYDNLWSGEPPGGPLPDGNYVDRFGCTWPVLNGGPTPELTLGATGLYANLLKTGGGAAVAEMSLNFQAAMVALGKPAVTSRDRWWVVNSYIAFTAPVGFDSSARCIVYPGGGSMSVELSRYDDGVTEGVKVDVYDENPVIPVTYANVFPYADYVLGTEFCEFTVRCNGSGGTTLPTVPEDLDGNLFPGNTIGGYVLMGTGVDPAAPGIMFLWHTDSTIVPLEATLVRTRIYRWRVA